MITSIVDWLDWAWGKVTRRGTKDYFWGQEVIRVAVRMPHNATDIRTQPVEAVSVGPYRADAVTKAVMAWKKALEGTVRVTASPSLQEAEIDIYFRPGAPKGVIGETKWWLIDEKKGQLGRSVIWIDADLTGDQLLETLMHELGHALGLREHSKSPRDVMYRRSRAGVRYRIPGSEAAQRVVDAIKKGRGN